MIESLHLFACIQQIGESFDDERKKSRIYIYKINR
jgi:hypothetical protein